MCGNLFVATNAKGADGETRFGVDGGLTGELLQNTAGAGETIAGFSDADVENELMDFKLAHRISGILPACDHYECEWVSTGS